METIRSEMQKKAHIMSVVFEVLRIVAIVALCIFVVSLAAISFLPKETALGSVTLRSGITMGGKLVSSWEDVLAVLPQLVFYVTNAVILLVLFSLARRMFASISREDTPFTMANVALLRRMGIAMMVSALLPGILRDVVAILQGAGTSDLLDMMPLVIGLILFLLSSIFAYGVRLQQEQDETV